MALNLEKGEGSDGGVRTRMASLSLGEPQPEPEDLMDDVGRREHILIGKLVHLGGSYNGLSGYVISVRGDSVFFIPESLWNPITVNVNDISHQEDGLLTSGLRSRLLPNNSESTHHCGSAHSLSLHQQAFLGMPLLRSVVTVYPAGCGPSDRVEGMKFPAASQSHRKRRHSELCELQNISNDDEEAGGQWLMPDIMVDIRKSCEDPPVSGIIREVFVDGSCSVAMGASGHEDRVICLPGEIKKVVPKKKDRVKITGGERGGSEGELVGIYDSSEGLVRIVDDSEIAIVAVDMALLAKVAEP